MISPKYFRSANGNLPLPVFFPDATRAVLRSLDTRDIEDTKTNGLLVNTLHLYKELGLDFVKKNNGIGKFMDWHGALISDSGGFQIGSLIKMYPGGGKVTDSGVTFKPVGEKEIVLTPEKSIEFQMELGVDMVVVLDDFTDPGATYDQARESVERTIVWAKKSKLKFDEICEAKKLKADEIPLILGVVQGGYFQDLRKHCIQELVKIGFDGFGFGGWPQNPDKTFDYESAKTICENAPEGSLLYGLGVGKPHEIVNLVNMGFSIFDCVLPTRDGRHGRAYVFNADSIDDINIGSVNEMSDPSFYKFVSLKKGKMINDNSKLSNSCDCLTCTRYTVSYLSHLFRINEFTAGRLVTIHNLRFYSLLMEKLRSRG